MKLSVVIPVYNEQGTILEIVSRALAAPYEKEIIVVNDGSTDETPLRLSDFKSHAAIKIIDHPENRGKGAALQTAFKEIRGDVVVIQDADLEYDPRDYPKLLEPLLDGRADVVFGSRFLGGPHRVLFFWHFIANGFLTLLSNMLTNINLTDMETGYKAFRSHVLKKVRIKSNRFGFEPEFTAKVAKHKFKIYEVPISYSGRGYEEGKKITWKDGISAIGFIIWYRIFN